MKIQNVVTIAKKELKGQVVNPTTYIIAGVFLAVWEFLFFQNVFLINEASVQGLFQILPWFFLLLIPAITMGSVAEETSNETLEILLTHPLQDRELLLGKFLSAFTFVVVLLLASVPIVFSLNAFGDVDLGVFVGQYVASLFLASALIGLGVAVSTYFRSQVPALMLSVISTFILIIIGSEIVTISLPSWLGTLFSRFSVLPHFDSLARGVLDLRDVWYFLLLTALFLQLGHIRLLLRRTNRFSKKVLRERAITIVLSSIFVVTVGFALFPTVRFDLTEGSIYTLTKATKDVLSQVPETVTITLYESKNLPAQLQPVSRTVKDVLRDYKTYGGSNVVVEYKDPDSDESAAQKAQEGGVRPAQFNVVGNGEFQVKQSYFGLTVVSGEEVRSIPLIQDTSDFEYQLTSFIQELTTTEKKKLVFLTTAGGKERSAFGTLFGELQKQFTVEDVTLSVASSTVPEGTDVLVLVGPLSMFDTLTASAVRDALARNVSVLALVDALEVNTQYMMALPNGTSTDDVLTEYGVTVNIDLAYDLRSNQPVQVRGAGGMPYIMPYPPYITAGVTQGVLPGSSIERVVIPWGSTLSVDANVANGKGYESVPLIYTTEFSGVQKGEFTIQPSNESFPATDLAQRILGVVLKPVQGEEGQDTPTARIVVVGDADFLTNAIGDPQSLALGMELVSYLAQEGSLASIKVKQNIARPLVFTEPVDRMWVQYGNIAGILILLVAVGAIVIIRRRGLRTLTYKEGKNR